MRVLRLGGKWVNAAERPGCLHFHGGGYIYGKPEIRDLENLRYSQALGVVICSVDYRMGPEYPTPAPLNDSYAALSWFVENADSWNVDISRIAIGGEFALTLFQDICYEF